MNPALRLARLLTEPAQADMLDVAGWTALIAVARAEQLLGTLAARIEGTAVPGDVAAILADARAGTAQGQRQALWEAEAARRALAHVAAPMVLLKGTAYIAAGLTAGTGRSVGDLDILVPHHVLDAVEAALLAAGWEWVKSDPYDDAYYRRWMHELPPLIHRDRDRMIDVHHTILPLTARRTPDAAALLADSIPLRDGWRTLSREDMVVHASVHLFADGDLAGGLRNLWDIDRLLRAFDNEDFWPRLAARARLHEATTPVQRAVRQAHALFATPIPEGWRRWDLADRFYRRRMLARDGWGRSTRPVTRFAFYLRSHWLRMPPGMLLRHLWIKSRY